jgi:hypothetical protein
MPMAAAGGWGGAGPWAVRKKGLNRKPTLLAQAKSSTDPPLQLLPADWLLRRDAFLAAVPAANNSPKATPTPAPRKGVRGERGRAWGTPMGGRAWGTCMGDGMERG